MEATNSSEELLTFDPFDPFGWILSVLGFVSLGFNVIVVTSILKSPTWKQFMSLVLNLIVADLGMTVFGCPIAAFLAFEGKWVLGDIGCSLYGFQGMLFGLASIGTVAALQVERYLSISESQQDKRQMVLSSFIWINAGFWSLAPLLGWHQYGKEPSGVSCTIDYSNNSLSYSTYLFAVLFVSYLFPLATMAVCELLIRKHEAVEATDTSKDTHVQALGSSSTFFALISVFLVCWTPYAVICTYSVFYDAATIPIMVVKLAPICAKCAAVLNPLVYLTVDSLRAAISHQLGFVTCQNSKKEN